MSTSKLIVVQKTWGDNRQLPSVYWKFLARSFNQKTPPETELLLLGALF